MKRLMIFSALLFSLSACSTQRILLNSEDRTTTPDSYEKSQPFFIYGIGQSQDFDVAQACGKKKPTRIETSQTFIDGLVGVVTFGIYTPRSIEVYCR